MLTDKNFTLFQQLWVTFFFFFILLLFPFFKQYINTIPNYLSFVFITVPHQVYRGTLTNGQLVAVKRAEQGSPQGDLEFKTEVELLSRVHHKNLVRLFGFCLEKGELILIYEYVPNGTLKESLSGIYICLICSFSLSSPCLHHQ